MNARFASDSTFAGILSGELTLARGSSGEAVRAVQAALRDMGFPMTVLRGDDAVPGVDAVFGKQTEIALTNFQVHASKRRERVHVTGALDAGTLEALDAMAPAPGRRAWETNQPGQAPSPFWRQPRTRLRIVVVKDEHRTFLYDDDGACVGIFPNSHGIAGSHTDEGLKKIAHKLDESSAKSVGRERWRSERAFGKRILDLRWATGESCGEELHGTYDYAHMGMNVSHGCVRHYNEDIIAIFDRVKVGDHVAIVGRVDDDRLVEDNRSELTAAR